MENNRQLRALILAAGFGNRLKSLTKTTPKPLLPFFYQPILYHTLDKLRLLNISDIWVNSHYLWEKIQKSLNNYKYLQTSLAIEKDSLLGTGGCIKNLPPSSKNLLVINGDIIFDLRLGYQMDRNSKLSLIINNLFNREYMSRPADMQPQRTIALQLSLKI